MITFFTVRELTFSQYAGSVDDCEKGASALKAYGADMKFQKFSRVQT